MYVLSLTISRYLANWAVHFKIIMFLWPKRPKRPKKARKVVFISGPPKVIKNFSGKLNDRHTENKLDEISNLLSEEVNRNKVDLVASYFQNLFSHLCSDMKRVQYKEFKSVKPRWYDSECRTIKRDKFKFLNLFVKTGYQYFYEKFRTLCNKFKRTVRANTKEDKNSLRKQIENSVNEQKLFWGLIKKVSRGSLVKTNIPAKSWFDYYRTLLNGKPNNVNLSFDRFVQSYLSTHARNCSICSGDDSSDYHELLEINKDFTDTEVREEINQAPKGKAHGVGGIINEAIKAAKDKLVPLLIKFFNTIFSNCLFPSGWRVGIKISLFKGGSRTNPSNYRGISLLSNLSKTFAGIINKRIVLWSEFKGFLSECEAGFRQKKSTVDQISS